MGCLSSWIKFLLILVWVWVDYELGFSVGLA